MASYYIDQTLTPYTYFGTGVWQEDCKLDQPKLKGPENASKICYGNGTYVVGGTGVSVEWFPVPGASFYVLQTSINSSFYGPDFRSYRITSPETYYNFLIGDIRFGETIYWRVWAYSESGCTSIKSEERSFTWDCDSVGGRNEDGQATEAPDINYCESYKVQLEIDGPDEMMCCDQDDWYAKIAYSCKDALGNEQIALVNTEWLVTKESGGSGKISEVAFEDRLLLVASCHVTQRIMITLKVKFREIATLREFYCIETKRVTINCDSKPKDKPWLTASLYSDDIHIVNPFYTDDPLGDVNHFTVPWLRDDSFLIHPLTLGSEKTALVVGPVFEVNSTRVASPSLYGHQQNDCCNPRFQSDYVYHSTLEARISMALGCGLRRFDNQIMLDLEEIAGSGLVYDEENCKLHATASGSAAAAYFAIVFSGPSEFSNKIENGESGTVNIIEAMSLDTPADLEEITNTYTTVVNRFHAPVWTGNLVLVQPITIPLDGGGEKVEHTIVAAFNGTILQAQLVNDTSPDDDLVEVTGIASLNGLTPYSVGDTLTVKNTMYMWGAAGEEVLLIYDRQPKNFMIVSVRRQPFIIYRGYLADVLDSVTDDASVTPQEALSCGFDVTALGTVTAENLMGCVGNSSTPVICGWNMETDTHYLLNVKHKIVEPIFDVYLDTGANMIKGKTKQISVMSWDQDFTEINLISTSEDCETP